MVELQLRGRHKQGFLMCCLMLCVNVRWRRAIKCAGWINPGRVWSLKSGPTEVANQMLRVWGLTVKQKLLMCHNVGSQLAVFRLFRVLRVCGTSCLISAKWYRPTLRSCL